MIKSFVLLSAGCLAVLIVAFTIAPSGDTSDDDVVASYKSDVDAIVARAQADTTGFDRLATLADTFGPRMAGSQNLEDAIDWILAEMARDGFENVHGEDVIFPKWTRGEEDLRMLAPRQARLRVLGLGGTVGTGPGGIEADAIVVRSFSELETRSHEAVGKIVVFNAPFTNYGQTVAYRVEGASRAAAAGAVGSLVRSVGPVSLYTPHTGMMRYADGVNKIPHAAITIEDAEMLQRFQDRGQTVRLSLALGAETEEGAVSRNIVAELRGSDLPDEMVIIGGHIDSWDVGTGAMDDAGGSVAAWQALVLLKEMGIRPRRTIRVVLWTNEENGVYGGTAYHDAHRDEIDNVVLAIESDAGVFRPTGFGFTGSHTAFATITEIGTLLDGISAGSITRGGGGADIFPLIREGVPGMGLSVDGDKYFWYHHTEADTIDKLDRGEFNLCVAAMASMAYVVADMPDRLDRISPDATD